MTELSSDKRECQQQRQEARPGLASCAAVMLSRDQREALARRYSPEQVRDVDSLLREHVCRTHPEITQRAVDSLAKANARNPAGYLRSVVQREVDAARSVAAQLDPEPPKLRDPTELERLTAEFARLTRRKNHCVEAGLREEANGLYDQLIALRSQILQLQRKRAA